MQPPYGRQEGRLPSATLTVGFQRFVCESRPGMCRGDDEVKVGMLLSALGNLNISSYRAAETLKYAYCICQFAQARLHVNYGIGHSLTVIMVTQCSCTCCWHRQHKGCFRCAYQGQWQCYLELSALLPRLHQVRLAVTLSESCEHTLSQIELHSRPPIQLWCALHPQNCWRN